MSKLDLTDRSQCFYWQTDRVLSPEEYKHIFLERHALSDEELLSVLKNGITSLPVESIHLIPADENVTKGNVNIVRKILVEGKTYVVRCHPKAVKNGYFWVEKVSTDIARAKGILAPNIFEIHEAVSDEDMDFMVMDELTGWTMDNYLLKNSSDEDTLLFLAGKTMAQLHNISVEGFGPFNNDIAKKEGRLLGYHPTQTDFIHTALDENLGRLVKLDVCDIQTTKNIAAVFGKYQFEPEKDPVLVHNDFADWNLLTDGKEITGVLDWDETIGADPIADLACWSMFFNINRFEKFLKGYTSNASLPKDYETRFHYYRLRYAVSKMALRAKRYLVDPSEEMKKKIAIGTKGLFEELSYFGK